MTQNWSQIYNLIKFFFWVLVRTSGAKLRFQLKSNWIFSLLHLLLYIYIYMAIIYILHTLIQVMYVLSSFLFLNGFMIKYLHMTVFGIEVWILIFLLHVQVPILGYLRDNKIYKFIQIKKNRMLHIYFLGCDIYQHHSEMEY